MKRPHIYFHIDVNSAFLSWSSLLHSGEEGYPEDIQKIPAAIGGNEQNRHGIVLAKSVEAKRYGVCTGSLWQERGKSVRDFWYFRRITISTSGAAER